MIRNMRNKLYFLFFMLSPLFGEEDNALPVEGQTYNYWHEFVNMLITLAVILTLVVISVWFLKRYMRSRMHNLNRGTGIKIYERRALNAKASLYIVDILGKSVVISESAAGIQLITELDPETDLDALLAPPQPAFRKSLRQKIFKLVRRDDSS